MQCTNFLDLKLYDIPNTVARTVEAIKALDVEMLTLHISGGTKIARSTKYSARKENKANWSNSTN